MPSLPWMMQVATQLATAGALLALAATPPQGALAWFALLAVLLAFISASQDVVIDAYRTDLLPPAERGLGASLNIMGYRLAMILSGGIALIWTDPQQGGGWSWPEVYRFMAVLMVAAAVVTVLLLPRLPDSAPRPASDARHDLRGFAAVLLAIIGGGLVVQDGRIAELVRLRDQLASGRGLSAAYAIEEAAELRWQLRRDRRSAQSYRVHFLRGRKRRPPA